MGFEGVNLIKKKDKWPGGSEHLMVGTNGMTYEVDMVSEPEKEVADS